MSRLPILIALIIILPSIQATVPTLPIARNAFAQTATSPNDSEKVRGIELFRQNRFAEASKVLRKVTDKDKADADAWCFLGLALVQQAKEVKNAAKAFEVAIKLRPNFPQALTGLAYSLFLRDKTDEALRKVQSAIKLDPNRADAQYIKALVLLRIGKPQEALTASNETIRLDPRLAAPYLLKSQALLSLISIPSSSKGPSEREVRLSSYREAAEALEKYLETTKLPEEKKAWADQLEALRFYGSLHSKKQTAADPLDPTDVQVKARVISKPEPQYSDEARQNGVVGTVILRVVFASDGTVKHILVTKALPHGLTQKAVEAARRIKFIPATQNGHPISMFIQLEYNFNLY
jgi:TonB family protein